MIKWSWVIGVFFVGALTSSAAVYSDVWTGAQEGRNGKTTQSWDRDELWLGRLWKPHIGSSVESRHFSRVFCPGLDLELLGLTAEADLESDMAFVIQLLSLEEPSPVEPGGFAVVPPLHVKETITAPTFKVAERIIPQFFTPEPDIQVDSYACYPEQGPTLSGSMIYVDDQPMDWLEPMHKPVVFASNEQFGAVPEPSTGMLGAVSLILLWRRKAP